MSSEEVLQQRSIRAAVFLGPNRVEVLDRPVPQLATRSDVLIAVEACGICGTDLHLLSDPPRHPATPGVVLGHEIVGRVVEVGSETVGIPVGERVVVAPNTWCGSCQMCRAGVLSACLHSSTIGIFRDGGLADVASVPERACHPISKHLPAQIAALTEPLSCVMNGLHRARPLPGEVAVIYGAGAIGLLFLAVLRSAGVRCIVVEPAQLRRATAASMGALGVVHPDPAEVSAAVRAYSPEGADLAVDAVGNQVAAAIRDTRPRGRILLFGMDSGAKAEIEQYDLTRRELVIAGTYVGAFSFPAAVRLQEAGLLDLSPIVTHWLGLERVGEAINALRSGAAAKAVLYPTGRLSG